jgi:hypothetical protein
MADNLTDVAEARALNWLTGNATTAPTLPLMVRLMTANGSDSVAGTEVVNGGGSAYAPQSVALSAAVGSGSASNSSDVVFTNMPAATVVGVEIWDSAGTPFRWWWGAAAAPKTTNLGDTLRILAGQLALTMQ